MSSFYYDDSADTVRVARIVWSFIGLVVVFAVVSVALWGLGVITSPIYGIGEQHKQINTAENRTLQQERFETLYHDIIAADQNLAPTRDSLAAARKAGDDQQALVWQTTLNGQLQHCNNIVAEYNADALKVSAELFRTTDLPEQIVSADPATDCQ